MTAQPLVVEDAREHELVADNPAIRDLGVIAYAGMPLTDGAGNVLGSLCAVDVVPRRWDPGQLDALEDLARMCSVALRLRLATVDADRERRRRDELDVRLREQLQHRTTVNHVLQRAMLSTLPRIEGLAMSAHYAPADSREDVGGDWYDVTRLPATSGTTTDVVLSVGDIAGHSLSAATEMGQVRSMLRQAAWDRRGEPPSVVVAAFEDANAAVGPRARGTLVVAHLRRESGRHVVDGVEQRRSPAAGAGRARGRPGGARRARPDVRVPAPAPQPPRGRLRAPSRRARWWSSTPTGSSSAAARTSTSGPPACSTPCTGCATTTSRRCPSGSSPSSRPARTTSWPSRSGWATRADARAVGVVS